ncbi:tRNA preQ1(34) S-adenosylmethionine ribosyltransferase-isomerase QueA [Acidicapsa acidisoli]|uniref:tRNA preQ1(34) S-adenosylmethionine ribosyltransferase-isomerase QueA n=1 Tax=Acidicapsa acidisoli TaxID=1615681 RepID=UPI0021DF7F4A|nr:tRNA preQ1(34) S-adenosylmethionine ribosyltransferase-isomerase QueA [Acidicapsa acidisoli]
MNPPHPSPQYESLRVADFDFHLPEELIAQQPPAERGASRMLVLNRAENSLTDSSFANLPSLLNPGDLLVLNDSRVIPARLYAHRVTSRGKQEPTGQIEVLLTSPDGAGNWNALVRPGRKVRVGDQLEFFAQEPVTSMEAAAKEGTEAKEGAGAFRPLNQPPAIGGFSPGSREPLLRAEVLASGEFGERLLQFAPVEDFFAVLEQIGHMPLPPYIKREDQTGDRERYQTVFASQRGSVAAPTAGLHFTPEILDATRARGVEIAKVTLHVGLGTFAPLRVERVDQIHLHSERYTLPAATAEALNRASAEGRRIVAVGTTAVRTLEHCAQAAQGRQLEPHTGETSIFISPGHQFRLVGAMLTNFHLPQSSLIMLVSAFAGRERVLEAYAHAVRECYRFFSYGDCMFLS